MEKYEDIFKKRGRSYHAAMEAFPEARNLEFEHASSFLKKEPGTTILDIPAGGGYLKKFLPHSIHYLAYDFAGAFEDGHSGTKKCKESKIDLPDFTADEIITLAAHHHIVDRDGFYQEIKRILKPKGRFVIGDVVIGSKEDPFLNGFLNQWNSMGHQGTFLDPEKDKQNLERHGFFVNYEKRSYTWNFPSKEDAQSYFRKLFFLDLNPSDQALENEFKKLGVALGDGYAVGWSLGFLSATKHTF